jgi:hypothetical protein
MGGGPKSLTVSFEVMTNPDIAGGAGPTIQICVNGGLVCTSKNYPANVDPTCPKSPLPRVGTYFSTNTPAPQGLKFDPVDIKEECGLHSLTLDYSSISGPITNLTIEFLSPTDYDGYRPPHVQSEPMSGDYHEDSNFVILGITIPGQTAHFISYPVNGAAYVLPPANGTIGPYVLWVNWEGTATFNVTTP